jgi:hypothetical protein
MAGRQASRSIRAAAGLYLLLGLGFGIPTPFTLEHLQRTGVLPMTPFGFRALAGPFEDLGVEPFRALGWTLVLVCALDVLAGIWLLQGRRRGALLALVTDPIALFLAYGFALPFLLIGIPIRVALVLAGWRSLR